MGSGINYMRTNMFANARPGVLKVAVLLSRYSSTSGMVPPNRTQSEAILARQAGIKIITVAAGTWNVPQEFMSAATYPSALNFYQLSGLSGLGSVVTNISRSVCGCQYITQPHP